jgi:hypothetical protein
MGKNDRTNWRVVTGTPVEKFDQQAIDPVLARIEALAFLPPFGKAKTGPCALCGSNGKLTYEHLPPRSTHNNKPAEVFGLPKNSMTPVHVTTLQQGSGGYTLCNTCNNFTGTEYVRNYQEWVATADHIVLTHHAAILEHNKSGTGFLNVPVLLGPSLHPGKFIRQILCMSASLCGPWLCDEYPIRSPYASIARFSWVQQESTQVVTGCSDKRTGTSCVSPSSHIHHFLSYCNLKGLKIHDWALKSAI